MKNETKDGCTYLVTVAVLVGVTFIAAVLGLVFVTSAVVVLAKSVIVDVIGFLIEYGVSVFPFNYRRRDFETA